MNTYKGKEEVEGVIMDVYEIKNGNKTHIVKERVKTEQDLLNESNRERKQELIKLMAEANALRDDATWQLAKDEYELLG